MLLLLSNYLGDLLRFTEGVLPAGRSGGQTIRCKSSPCLCPHSRARCGLFAAILNAKLWVYKNTRMGLGIRVLAYS
jgi:hypothetical protein